MLISWTTVITITGTFVAGIVSQVISHHFTKKREGKKHCQECYYNLFSPLSVKLYKYIFEEYDTKKKEELWQEIIQMIKGNYKYISLELIHAYDTCTSNPNKHMRFMFFQEFFKEYDNLVRRLKVSNRVTVISLTPLPLANRIITSEYLLEIFKLYSILEKAFDSRVASLVFKLPYDFNNIPIRELKKTLNILLPLSPRSFTQDNEYQEFDKYIENDFISWCSVKLAEDWRTKINDCLNEQQKYIYDIDLEQNLNPHGMANFGFKISLFGKYKKKKKDVTL